jgi:hypothetical protein
MSLLLGGGLEVGLEKARLEMSFKGACQWRWGAGVGKEKVNELNKKEERE